MDKTVLKKIAKDWSAGILFATGSDSFEDDSLLNQEEQDYVVSEVKKIARKLSDDPIQTSLKEIVGKYYMTL